MLLSLFPDPSQSKRLTAPLPSMAYVAERFLLYSTLIRKRIFNTTSDTLFLADQTLLRLLLVLNFDMRTNFNPTSDTLFSVLAFQTLLRALSDTRMRTQQELDINNLSIGGIYKGLYNRVSEMRYLDYSLKRFLEDNTALMAFCSERDAKVVHEAIEGM
jgi:hypothetical protein